MSFDNITNKSVTFPKGSFIFKRNDFTRDLYIIKSGKVRVYKQVGVRTIILAELGKGAIFGEVAAIDGGPRSATVQALEDTEAFVITAQEFKQKTAGMPEWFSKISKILVQRLRDTDKRIESDNTGNSEYNVMLLLTYFIACEGRDEGNGAKSLDLKNTQDELTELLRIQFKTLTEIMDFLKEKSLIEIRQNHLFVPNPEALEKHAKQLQEQAAKGIFI